MEQIDHDQWLRHPGTKLFVQWLDKEIDKQVSLIGRTSGEYEPHTLEKLGRFSMRLETLRTVRKAAYDSQIIIGPSGTE